MLDAEDYPSAFIDIDGLRLEFCRAKRTADGILADVKITMTDEKVENK
jgi:methionyl-tRNA formyltransferase